MVLRHDIPKSPFTCVKIIEKPLDMCKKRNAQKSAVRFFEGPKKCARSCLDRFHFLHLVKQNNQKFGVANHETIVATTRSERNTSKTLRAIGWAHNQLQDHPIASGKNRGLLYGWLAGSLAGWLAPCLPLPGWLAGWLARWLAACLPACLPATAAAAEASGFGRNRSRNKFHLAR